MGAEEHRPSAKRMHGMIPASRSVVTLTDDEIENRLLRLVGGERHVLVVFLEHLAEFDARRAHLGRSYPSLFEYCTRRLGLSEAEAYLRIQGARLAREHPGVSKMLADGRIHLSALARLSRHLAKGDPAPLLERAAGKTLREVERLVVDLEPGRPAPSADVVRALPPPPPREPTAPDPTTLPLPVSQDVPRPEMAAAPSPPAPRLVRISFTAPEGLLQEIEKAKALLRHKHPAGRLEDVIGEALNALMAKIDPGRRTTKRSSKSERAWRRRRVPQAVRDVVWRRDEGRCAFVSPDGRRCESTAWLEYDHVRPWARGGRSDDPANIRLLCRAHNQHEACLAFGDGKGAGH